HHRPARAKNAHTNRGLHHQLHRFQRLLPKDVSGCDSSFWEGQWCAMRIFVFEAYPELSVVEVELPRFIDDLAVYVIKKPRALIEPIVRWKFSPFFPGHAGPNRPKPVDVRVMDRKDGIEGRGRRRGHGPHRRI